MTKISPVFYISIISVFLILFTINTIRADTKIKTVAVFPFEVIAKEDSNFIGKGMGKMLCSRIASDNTILVKCMDHIPSDYGLDLTSPSIAGKTAAVTELNGVDYILVGTITIAGDSVSSDARLIEVIKPDNVKFISASGTGVGDIMQHASSISEKVKISLLGSTTQNTNIDSNITEIPNIKDKAALPTFSAPKNIPPQKIELTSDESIIFNHKLDMEIRGIAISDIDGDGQLDIAVIDKHKVILLTFADNTLIKKEDYEGKYYNTNISIDALDINGNGKNELFITSVDKNNTLKSYILEWNGIEFKTIAKDVDWYLRVLNYGGKPKLMGQKRGRDEIFSGNIYSLDLSENNILKGSKVVSNNFSVFGFTPLNINNGIKLNTKAESGKQNLDSTLNFIWFDRSGFLNFGNNSGSKEWKSIKSFGSTALFIEQDRGKDNLKERIYINNRIVPCDINNDGISEIITVNNSDAAKGYLSGYRKFNQGNIEIMAWKNGSMVDIWKSNPATGGYVSDFSVVDIDGDGYSEVIYSVVTDSGVLMSKSHSTVFIEKIVRQQK